jgi:uncharacterized membrane protein YhaH (DUF805 family)
MAFRKYFDFTGRARRKEYWYFTLFYCLSIFLSVILDMLFGTFNPQASLGWVTLVYLLASLCPMLAVSVRRLHDIGRSGWWVLLNLVPGFGSAALSVIALFDSQPGSNAFGFNPKLETGESGSSAFDSDKRPPRNRGARAAKTAAIGVAVVAFMVGAAWIWWDQNSAELLANGKAHLDKGMAAGRGLDESGCVALAATALGGEPGTSMAAGIANSVELSGCLETSRVTPGFCDAIPSRTEIFAAGQWIAGVCTQIGYGGNTSCNTMIQQIPQYCVSQKRAKKLDSESTGKA